VVSNLIKAMLEYVGFEAFTAATMKNAVLWDLAPCG
jgi:hypothetical protein